MASLWEERQLTSIGRPCGQPVFRIVIFGQRGSGALWAQVLRPWRYYSAESLHVLIETDFLP